MTRARWTRERWLDLVFLVGFAAKAIDGFVELAVGLPLLVLRPVQVEAVVRLLTAGELREDPDDLLAHVIRHGAASFSADATVLAAVYLIVHGAVKLGIVAAVFRGSRRLYPWAIAALSGFVAWQCVEFVLHPGVGLALLTVFDLVVVALTVRECRHHRGLGDALGGMMGHDTPDLRRHSSAAPPWRNAL